MALLILGFQPGSPGFGLLDAKGVKGYIGVVGPQQACFSVWQCSQETNVLLLEAELQLHLTGMLHLAFRPSVLGSGKVFLKLCVQWLEVVALEPRFSTSSLLTSWARYFFFVGAVLCILGCFEVFLPN